MPDTATDLDLADLTRVDHRKLLDTTLDAICGFIDDLPERRVGADTTPHGTAELRSRLDEPLTRHGDDPMQIISQLAALAPNHVVASRGPRFGGYVVGGCHPAAQAADMLAAAWDQFAATYVAAPLITTAEQIALGWLAELLGLDSDPTRELSGGFTTGTTESHIVALGAAFTHLHGQMGRDLTQHGWYAAPPTRVLMPATAHRSVEHALSVLGFGRANAERIPVGPMGETRTIALIDELARRPTVPTVVVAQAGNIDTGAFDDLDSIGRICATRDNVWLHIDGAFGLPAGMSPRLRHLTKGAYLADSWGFDGHKMLQAPYDVGMVFTAHPQAHVSAMSTDAPYTTIGPGTDPSDRTGMNYCLGMARRGRGLPVYAVLRALGRDGLAAVMDRCHDNAVRLGEQLREYVHTPVVFNQVLLDVAGPEMPTERTHPFVQTVIDRVNEEGRCWVGGTRWGGRSMVRYSFANSDTTADDVDEIADALRQGIAAAKA